MPFKNNLLAFEKHFVMPFCFSAFLPISSLGFFIVYLFELKIPHLANITTHSSILISFFLLITYIFCASFKTKNVLWITEIHKCVFLLSISILLISFITTSINISIPNSLTLNIIFSLLSFSSGIFIILTQNNLPIGYEGPLDKKTEKNNKFTILVFFIIVGLIGIFLLFLNLGKNNLMNDEFPTISSSWNFSQTGNFYKWDWLHQNSSEFTILSIKDQWANYTRAELHTVLLAVTYKLFGVSEFTSRSLSALFGVILFLSTIFIVQNSTKSSKIALLAFFLTISSPFILEYERYSRMYALLLPINLIFVFSVFKTIEIFSEMKIDFKKLILWGIITLFFLICSLNLHDLTLISIPAICLFTLIYLYIHNRKLFRIATAVTGVSIIVFTLFFSTISNSNQAFTFLNLFERQYPINYIYFSYIFKSPIGIAGPIIISIWFIREIFIQKNKNYFYIYLYTIVVSALFILTFVIDRFSHPTYIVSFAPLYVILLAIGSYNLLITLKNKRLIVPLIMLALYSIGTSFVSAYPKIYGTQNPYRVDYKSGYAPMKEIFNPQEDGLFIQYERFYYMQNLGKDTEIFTFGNKNYSANAELSFFQELQIKKTSWITWEISTDGDIKTSTKVFIKKYCDDYSVLNSNLFLYRCRGREILQYMPKNIWEQ
jgi:hypothetical protein